MGLSSKQVSKDVLDWGKTLMHTPTMSTFPNKRQHQQQQSPEVLKCPRCDSTNTKFCYYNNYNKSQPRHFCKSCKRHWTKGGTLRNVPVGGGRKNKRLKTTTTTPKTTAAATTGSSMITSTANNNNNDQMPIPTDHQQHCQNQRSISEFLCQSMSRPQYSSLQQDYSTINRGISSCSNNILNIEKNSSNNKNDGVFLGGSSLPLNLRFPFSSSGSFGSDPSLNSTCFQSSKEAYDDYIGGNYQQPWQVPTTSILMDMPSYLGNNNSTTTTTWDDFDTFVSTDLNSTWDDDDSDIKPC